MKMNNVNNNHISDNNHTDYNNHIDDNNYIDHLERLGNSFICTLDELCNGTAGTSSTADAQTSPESHFESWCVRRLYPALTLSDVLQLRPDRIMYEKRISELCARKAENEFDAWLRERVYPIVALLW